MTDDTAKPTNVFGLIDGNLPELPARPRDVLFDAITDIALSRLCARLGIKMDRSTTMWVELGMALVEEQPEFRRIFAKRRGRRKGSVPQSSLDLKALRISEEVSIADGFPFNEVLSTLVRLWQNNGLFLGSANNPTSHRAVVNRLKRIKDSLPTTQQ